MKRLVRKHIGLHSHLALVPIFALSIGVFCSCEDLTDVMGTVEPPVYENPVDPDGNTWVPPSTTITGGPADNSTVTTPAITFTWMGNDNATVFRVRISGGVYPGTWSPWSGNTALTLDLLDELDYTFEVQAGYPSTTGTPEFVDDTPARRSFTVDAVQGPALRISPRVVLINRNDSFNLEIVAEDVTDLTMLNLRLRFDPARLSFTDLSHGTFLTSNGGSILQFPIEVDDAAGIIDISLGVAGADPPGVTGTGSVMTLHFHSHASGETDVFFDPSLTLLRDHQNQGISPQSLVGARVIIQ